MLGTYCIVNTSLSSVREKEINKTQAVLIRQFHTQHLIRAHGVSAGLAEVVRGPEFRGRVAQVGWGCWAGFPEEGLQLDSYRQRVMAGAKEKAEGSQTRI